MKFGRGKLRLGLILGFAIACALAVWFSKKHFDRSPIVIAGPGRPAGKDRTDLHITIECDEPPSVPTRVDVGTLDFGERHRVTWTLARKQATPIQLARLGLDCSCIEAAPTTGLVTRDAPLHGYIDYSNNNLGASTRTVHFETSVGQFPLQLSSVKLRDHFVSPNVARVSDEHLDIEWTAVYLSERKPPRFHIKDVQADKRFLRLDRVPKVTAGSRMVRSGDREYRYDTETFLLPFLVPDGCPIGRQETEVSIRIKDLGGKVPDHDWRIPVWLNVTRGIVTKPSAVSWGYQSVDTLQWPVQQTVEIEGLNGRVISSVAVSPNAPWVKVHMGEATPDRVTLSVQVNQNVPLGKAWEALVTLIVKDSTGSKESKVNIPVSGMFVSK